MVYRITEDMIKIEDTDVKTFGIAAFDDDGELLESVSDITTIRQKAETLLEKCKRLGVSPCQLADVAEDFIISDEY